MFSATTFALPLTSNAAFVLDVCEILPPASLDVIFIPAAFEELSKDVIVCPHKSSVISLPACPAPEYTTSPASAKRRTVQPFVACASASFTLE